MIDVVDIVYNLFDVVEIVCCDLSIAKKLFECLLIIDNILLRM